ncbi:L-histidine N(alpha)-methyltransferase [Anaeromyxobacter oryzisoli]|uniref:L-histidine N(alpha)-methyltransferase n=1 Tax=Anaeromyxobacter oryzisoli TaxID=2925408 RepID=UPI001F575A5F|nr:L-histidine N(alpha)-methyltransferase [Anaeromyxobacter sp. SG63]
MTDVEGAGFVVEARPESGRFLAEVLAGLGAPRKALSPKWLYDARGSALYELICEQPEYYPARTELAILERHLGEIAGAIGPEVLVFEYGAGSGRKTVELLAALERPTGYLPVDISATALAEAARRLSRQFPGLPIRPVVGDFTEGIALPDADLACARRLAFLPGSTIGNFDPPEAVALLRRMARDAGAGGKLLIGVDPPKDEGTLRRAYDDARGVTAAFDLNLLARIDRELGGDLRLDRFRHLAVWNGRLGRVEMHLESVEAQLVHVAGASFTFRERETIHTESAYKWEPRAFDALAAIGGWRLDRTWTDERAWFSVRLYERA